MKKIISIALMVMALSPLASMAQSPDCKAGASEKTCCKKDKKCKKSERPCPFDGLNLTDSQRARLSELNAKREAARKEGMKAEKELKQRFDSTRNEAKKAAKEAYLKEVREIVGPENYVKFLENMVVNQGGKEHKNGVRPHDGNKDRKMKDGNRKEGKFDKGNKGNKDKSEKRNGKREGRK